MGIKGLILIYFAVTGVYCAISVREHMGFLISADFSLKQMRFVARCLFHWLGLIACVGILAKQFWARRLFLIAAGLLTALSAVFIIKRIVAYLLFNSARLNIFEILQSIYITNTYEVFNFFIMMFFFLHFCEKEKVPS